VKNFYLLLSPAKGGVVQMEQQTENDACSVEEKPGQQQASPPPEAEVLVRKLSQLIPLS
jgi:hypothetical protein